MKPCIFFMQGFLFFTAAKGRVIMTTRQEPSGSEIQSFIIKKVEAIARLLPSDDYHQASGLRNLNFRQL